MPKTFKVYPFKAIKIVSFMTIVIASASKKHELIENLLL